jgi:tetratricopeptide (TPR) repeat protein
MRLNTLTSRLHAAGRLILLIALLCTGAQASAADKDQYLLSQSTYKALSEIQKLMEDDKYTAAEKGLTELLAGLEKKPYDQAVSLQTLAYLHSNNGDYKKAANAFGAALKLNALPEDVTHTLRYNYSQLLIYTEAYAEGIKQLEQWIRDEKKPSNDAMYLAANAYYQLDKFRESANYLEKLLRNQSQPQQSWLQMLLACYYELKEYKSSVGVLQTLLKMQPDNKSYWQQLVGIYQRLDYEKSALASMELMYSKGLLDGTEKLRLGKMYLYNNMPYKAAGLLNTEMDNGALEKSVENLSLLADSWILAQEPQQAIAVLEQATPLAEDGQLHFRLGRLFVDSEQWEKAHAELGIALKKGKLRETGTAQLLLGISAWRSGKAEQSIQALRQALKHDSSKDQAEWWLDYIKRSRAGTAS